MLVGTVAGASLTGLVAVHHWLQTLLGLPAPRPDAHLLDLLLGARETLAAIVDCGVQAIAMSMALLLLMLLLRGALRREPLAAAGLIVLMGLQSALLSAVNIWIGLAFGLVVWSIVTFVLLRYGLLATIVGLFVILLLGDMPLTSRLDHWTAVPTLWVMATITGVAVWGAWASLGGRPLFRESLLDS
jgi:hypothetical protein